MGKRSWSSNTAHSRSPSRSEGQTPPPEESPPEKPSKRARIDDKEPAKDAEPDKTCIDCDIMWFGLKGLRKENSALEQKLGAAEQRIMELELQVSALERTQARESGQKESSKKRRLQVPQESGVNLNKRADGIAVEGVEVGVPLPCTSGGSNMALAAASDQPAPTSGEDDVGHLTATEWLSKGVTSIVRRTGKGSSPGTPTRRYRLVDIETGKAVNQSDCNAPTIVYRLEGDEKDGATAPIVFGSSPLAELAVFEKTKIIQSGVTGTFCFYESFEALVACSTYLFIHAYAHHSSTETLLLSRCMKAWAKKKGSRGFITCGHHGLNDILPMVQALNAVAEEGAEPMTILPVSMPDQSTMHSKAITGYDANTDSIIVLIGSANLSKLGMASSKTGVAWLNALERFHCELYQAGRLIEAVATKTERPSDPDIVRLTSELNAAKKHAAKSKPLEKPAPLSLSITAATAFGGPVVVDAQEDQSTNSSLCCLEQLPDPTDVGELTLHGVSTAASAPPDGTVFGARVCLRCFESTLIDQATSMGQSGGKKSKVKHPSSATQQPTPPCSAQGRLGEEFVFVPLDRSQSPPVWQEGLKTLPPVLSSVGLTIRLPNGALRLLRGIEYGWYGSLEKNIDGPEIYSSFKQFAQNLSSRCPLLQGSIDSLTNPAMGKWFSERFGPEVYLCRTVVDGQGSKSKTTVVAGRGAKVLQHFLSLSVK